jgi:radical SAM superfamily enzyme YgiQ (UPF0313 family)
MLILVNPKYPHYPFGDIHPLPIGLGYISEALLSNNINHVIFDLNFQTLDNLIDHCISHDIHYIAFSLTSLDIEYNYDIIKVLKAKCSTIKIIVGGPHISFTKQQVMKDCKAIDFAVTHEGEFSIIDILRDNYIDKCGIIYRDESSIIYHGDRQWITDFSTINFPRYSKFNINLYEKRIPIVFSRGCPYSCTFCGAYLSMGRKYRYKTAEQLFNEIYYWYCRDKKIINFVDSEFFLKPEILHECLMMMKKSNMSDIIMTADGLRGNSMTNMTIELLKEIKNFGFSEVAMGIESANDDILKTIKKGETLLDIKKALLMLNTLDIKVIAFFIIGLPGETIKHVFNSFVFSLQYEIIKDAYFFNINPLPGTEIYKWAETHHYFTKNFSKKNLFENIGGGGGQILI